MSMRTIGAAGLLLAAVSASLAAAQTTDDPADSLTAARQALARWVETQQVIAKEKKDWELAREVLEQRVRLLRDEAEALDQRIADSRAQIAETERKRYEIVSQRRELETAEEQLRSVVSGLESRTRGLVAVLPVPLAERVAPLAERIPADPASTKHSLGERFQNVIGILNEVNKFNQEITVSREVRELPGGETAEVRTLYLGLAQGYYVTSGGDVAGVGQPGPEGWTWVAANDLAGEITTAIAILDNEKPPAYVPLPVTID